MRILIIEDEKHNAARLQRIIGDISADHEVLGILESVEDAVEWFSLHPAPDVALMDIRLTDGLSFDIFKETTVACPVIFTTAYDEYAVRAFKVNSVDYLLKPIQEEDLQQALDRITPVHRSQEPLADIEQLIQLMQPQTKAYRKRFLLPVYDGFKTIQVEDICFAYSELKATKLVLGNEEEEIVTYSLDELEEDLDPEYFFRANRQFLIHVNAISKIHNSFNGKLKVELKHHPEKEVLISKDKAARFKQWLDK
ncbi:two-component system LytT family response regulator [Chitinophaga dinghuensis]|uniref:Two-component system LytT family response regulator n=1 Tax=Chitinophaga dinghuensis TaxID=1539050 RepID=A0A327VT21_9BACT|nr:LytTR family DNA-binding domain-containing protein [Chitinophaga dinghuensis]RAJ77554.1 two-component system LytT family response regulator [Chitinophaga dinghuensis]